MEIEIINDGKDPREGRNKTLTKGMKITCTPEVGKLFIDGKIGKDFDAGIKPRKVIKTVEEAKQFEGK